MNKEIMIILDELNYTISKLNQKEKDKKTLKDSQYWYREGLKKAREIVMNVEKINSDKKA